VPSDDWEKSPEDVEKVQQVIEAVATWAGKSVEDRPRVTDEIQDFFWFTRESSKSVFWGMVINTYLDT